MLIVVQNRDGYEILRVLSIVYAANVTFIVAYIIYQIELKGYIRSYHKMFTRMDTYQIMSDDCSRAYSNEFRSIHSS
jgi:hypothetical protein